MNYMLPLYLDYLERPEIYESAYLREYKAKGMKLQSAHKTAKTIAKKTDIQRRIDDLKALNKVTHKGVKKKLALKTAATKLKIAQQQASKLKPVVKKVAPKAGTFFKTAKSLGGKAALVAGGAAAAYGGYKLYKRHLSKAAQKCKGTSGAERTLCLQQNTKSN